MKEIEEAIEIIREFLPVYETAYPGDFRPRAALDASAADKQQAVILRDAAIDAFIEATQTEKRCCICPGLHARIAEAAFYVAHARIGNTGWAWTAVDAICRGLPTDSPRRQEILGLIPLAKGLNYE